MSFRIAGLSPSRFTTLFGQPEHVLSALGAKRSIVDEYPGFPCRISLEDVPLGETVLLVNFEHQPAATPYRSRHAIFVREGAVQAALDIDEVPPVLHRRLLSVRAFDRDDMMVDAEIVEGRELQSLADRMLAAANVHYLHLHFAKRGCFAARLDRS